jgi:thiol:disulfide interchange protein DsbC
VVKANWTNLAFGALLGTALAGASWADTKEEIAAKLNGVSADNLTDSPIAGVYQVQLGSRIAYVTSDGRYLMQGELYDLQTSENLTEQTRAQARVAMLDQVPREDMIIFPATGGETKYTIKIFTDVDCGYCRQFHREIDRVNALGIEVQYLSYPRTGPNTESWYKAEKVWCAGEEARHAALTQAKLGGAVPDEICEDNPVSEEYDLGQAIGVRGTPAIVAANGEIIGGYMPPDALLETLEGLSQ